MTTFLKCSMLKAGYVKCSKDTMRAGETKKTAFKRLAKSRTGRVIKNLSLIGNLSNRNNYTYSEKEFKLIFKRIEGEVKLAKSRFQVALNKKRRRDFGFR